MEEWVRREIEEMLKEFKRLRDEFARMEQEMLQPLFHPEEKTVVPLYEVRRESDKIIVWADLAGVRDKNNVDVRVEGRTLKIEALFSKPFKLEGFTFLREGLQRYKLEIPLPENIDLDKIKATLKKGILEIEIPLKVERFKIKVE
ncbi:MAG: Hsp20/alpha crystallin family protein [Infirmifilum sp.]|jgi:HSP20 family protein|uniref:SHSP domain-containing protein n=1 Tax=Infirmifilum uzonense TaxID=1550241 RepID=A0A0F7FIW3_9CREN|nr:Hsp20/alpha crystallin family protein [Infirmifilum uzonense]AKG38865.1 hypothetical protein MA03_05760 [Infirmifilum uzonense]